MASRPPRTSGVHIDKRGNSMAEPAAPGFPPSVFIIGAQKAGTTFLAARLDAHPAFSLAQPKEPDYFTRHFARGADWYRTCFPILEGDGPLAILVDASTSYTMYGPEVGPAGTDPARRLQAANPAARVIYMVRHPVARAYSAYLHARRYGGESRPFDACLQPESGYVMGSRYAFQLDHYRRVFPADQISLVIAEALWTQPESVLNDILRVLGITPAPTTPTSSESSPNPGQEKALNAAVVFNPVGTILTRLLGSAGLKRINTGAKALLPAPLHAALKRAITRAPPSITTAQHHRLRDLLAADTHRFACETGIVYDLSTEAAPPHMKIGRAVIPLA